MRAVPFAYAGARIQARYGARVPASQWERLLRIEAFGAFLQAARDTPLRSWTLQLDPNADAHQIEALLRLRFRRHVAEVAQWAPPAWRDAVEWCAVLPDLPAIAHRLRGETDLSWMAGDAQLPRSAPKSRDAWLARWREQWPALPAGEREGHEELVGLLRAVVAGAAVDAPAALARAQRPLRRLFRRHARAPAGLFIHLVLTWQELAVLRGALLRRRLGLPIEGAA